MLNKRTSDILYIALYVIVVAAVIGVRIFLIGFYDERIESNEADNERLRTEIIAESQIVEAHRQSPLPSLFSLHQKIPQEYNTDSLRRNVTNIVNRAGVMHNESTNLSINIGGDRLGPGQFEGTAYESLARDTAFHEVTILFTAQHSADGSTPNEVIAILDYFEANNQMFLLRSIRYEPYNDETVVRITYYAVYQRN